MLFLNVYIGSYCPFVLEAAGSIHTDSVWVFVSYSNCLSAICDPAVNAGCKWSYTRISSKLHLNLDDIVWHISWRFSVFVFRLCFLTSAVYAVGIETFDSSRIIIIIIIIKIYKLRITTGVFTNIGTDVKWSGKKRENLKQGLAKKERKQKVARGRNMERELQYRIICRLSV